MKVDTFFEAMGMIDEQYLRLDETVHSPDAAPRETEEPVMCPIEPYSRGSWLLHRLMPEVCCAALCIAGGMLLLHTLFPSKFFFVGNGSQNSGAVSEISGDASADSVDPFAQPPQSGGEPDISYGFGMTDPPEDRLIAFADEVTLPLWVENDGDDAQFRLFVFADGILQNVQLDGEDTSVFSVKNGERRALSAVFRPVTAGAEPAALTYALMFDPGFTPESERTQFGNHLRMTDVSLFSLSAGYAEAADDVVSVQAESVTAAVQKRYTVRSAEGMGNQLLHTTFFTCENADSDKSGNAVRRSDRVVLRLAGGALTGTWRVSAYCGSAQVAAFDGRRYLDMTADANTMSEYTLSLDAFPASKQYSALYFLAVPLDSAHTLLQTHPLVLAADTVQTAPPVTTTTETAFTETTETTASESQTAPCALADYLNAHTEYTPVYAVSESKTLLRIRQGRAFAYTVYDSETDTQREPAAFDIKPQCRKEGFWVLEKAEPGEPAMRFLGDSQAFDSTAKDYAALLMYDYDMHLLERVDLREYGTVTAIEADLRTKTVYCAVSEGFAAEDGYHAVYRLLHRSADGTEESELDKWEYSPADRTPHALGEIDRLILTGDSLIWPGTALPERPEQEYRHAWGVFDCKTKQRTLHDSENLYLWMIPAGDCVFAVCNYDSYNPSAPCFVRRINADGGASEYKIENPLELETHDCFDFQSGDYYATFMQTQRAEGGWIARVTVYDSTGQCIRKADLTTESSWRFSGYFLLPQTRTVLVQSADGWQTVRF